MKSNEAKVIKMPVISWMEMDESKSLQQKKTLYTPQPSEITTAKTIATNRIQFTFIRTAKNVIPVADNMVMAERIPAAMTYNIMSKITEPNVVNHVSENDKNKK